MAGRLGFLEDLAQLFFPAAAVVQLGQGILLDHGTKRALHGHGTATDITQFITAFCYGMIQCGVQIPGGYLRQEAVNME